MSGITGILAQPNFTNVRSDIDLMTRSVSHRGPDGQAVWAQEGDGIALGHVLLATTPEAEDENQPLLLQSGHIALSADLRIDNRQDVLKSLRTGGRGDSRLTDPDLLAQAYLKWGTDCVDHIVGDFAFAIWDDRHNRLFCARDPMGVKPFYYTSTRSIFAFASETRALLGLSHVSDRINERSAFAFLSGNASPRAETIFADLESLEPGHRICASPDLSTSSKRYWNPAQDIEELDYGDDHRYENEFLEIFKKAVLSNLRSNKGVGIRLSGGLDSSAIASLAAIYSNNPSSSMYTFSKVYPSLPESKKRLADERQYIEAVLEKFPFNSQFTDASDLSPLYKLEELIEIWGQPFNIRGQCFSFETLAEARRLGVRNLLDGSEGDAVVGYGHDFLAKLARQDEWKRFAKVASQHSKNCQDGGRNYPPEKAFWNHGFSFVLEQLRRGKVVQFYKSATSASEALGISYYSILKRSAYWIWPDQWREKIDGLRATKPDIVSPERLRRLEIRPQKRTSSNESTLVRRAQSLQRSRMLTDALESTDPVFAFHHTEARHPFYDRRVIEYCLSLPPEQRFKGGWTRSIMRRALRDVLPNTIQYRLGKGRVGVAIAHNLRRFEDDRLTELILDDILRPFVDRTTAVGLLERYRNADGLSYRLVSPLLRIAVLAMWLRKRKRGKLEGPLEMKNHPKEY